MTRFRERFTVVTIAAIMGVLTLSGCMRASVDPGPVTDIKEEIHNNTVIVGDRNIPFTPMDRSSRKKVNKETLALNDT